MEKIAFGCSFFLFTIFSSFGSVDAKDILIRNFSYCEDDKTPHRLNVSIQDVGKGKPQLINGTLTLPYDLDDKIMLHIVAYLSVHGKGYVKLADINEPFCVLMKKYVGPFFGELEKAVGLNPGTCPVPKSNYHVSNYSLDMRKLFVKEMFPNGKVKLEVTSTNLRTGKRGICVIVLIDVM